MEPKERTFYRLGKSRGRGPRSETSANGAHGRTVHALGRAIVAGEYAEGEVLPKDTELMARLDVSRTALREVLRVLGAKGLVVSVQRKGAVVQPRSEWNLLDADVLAWHGAGELGEKFVNDTVEVREAFEPLAAQLAARRATPEDVARLEHFAREMARAAGEIDRSDAAIEHYFAADLGFHDAVLMASHNDLIRQFGPVFASVLKASFQQQRRVISAERALESSRLHIRVAADIARGDTSAAESTMRLVLASGRTELERAIGIK